MVVSLKGAELVVTLARAASRDPYQWSQLLRCRHGRLRSLRLPLLHREFKTSLKGELPCLPSAGTSALCHLPDSGSAFCLLYFERRRGKQTLGKTSPTLHVASDDTHLAIYIFEVFLVSGKPKVCAVCFTCMHNFSTRHLIGIEI